jgi:hypothetical protein
MMALVGMMNLNLPFPVDLIDLVRARAKEVPRPAVFVGTLPPPPHHLLAKIANHL